MPAGERIILGAGAEATAEFSVNVALITSPPAEGIDIVCGEEV